MKLSGARVVVTGARSPGSNACGSRSTSTPDAVVNAIVDAIQRDKRHVRLPKRSSLFPLIVEAPRRLTEFLLAGVKT